MRDYCRGTKAHNCLTIDDLDQAEMWGSFRVGKRYFPQNINFIKDENEISFSGSYNGYKNLIGDGIKHNRTILFSKKEKTINVIDKVCGKGIHIAKSHIHLHPDVQISQTEGGFQLQRCGISLKLTTDNMNTSVLSSYYCSEFGKKVENKVIVLSSQIPCELEYQIICC